MQRVVKLRVAFPRSIDRKQQNKVVPVHAPPRLQAGKVTHAAAVHRRAQLAGQVRRAPGEQRVERLGVAQPEEVVGQLGFALL